MGWKTRSEVLHSIHSIPPFIHTIHSLMIFFLFRCIRSVMSFPSMDGWMHGKHEWMDGWQPLGIAGVVHLLSHLSGSLSAMKKYAASSFVFLLFALLCGYWYQTAAPHAKRLSRAEIRDTPHAYVRSKHHTVPPPNQPTNQR